jgi:hypothetical protein
MIHFYDGQIRRYLIQIIRLLSNFVVKYGDGTLVQVPVMYGDPDRQVANIINQNSENAAQNSPRIAVYITDLELDTSRLADSSFVGKVNIRERAVDANGQYLNYEGDNYTIERLMPTPFKLSFKVDIWSSSNDQKLQILEQLLMMFNPSLEIQTTDNFVDWASLSVVDLVQITYSSRSIPVGTADEIDVATLSLMTPIYISPPAKVKRLGVITSVISNIFGSSSGPYGNYVDGLGTDPEGSSRGISVPIAKEITTVSNFNIDVSELGAKLLSSSGEPTNWVELITVMPGEYQPGLSRIYLTQTNGSYIVGYISLNPLDDTVMSVNWDPDSFQSNSEIPSTIRSSLGTFDAIIDPLKTGPTNVVAGTRYLILESIGGGIKQRFITDAKLKRIDTGIVHSKVDDHKVFVNGVEVSSGNQRIPNDLATGMYYITLDEVAPLGSEIYYELYVNQDGPDAWKSVAGEDFIAEENDVIEWNGDKWTVVFRASEHQDTIVRLANMFSNTQYTWNGAFWSKSFERSYRRGEWRLEL